MGGPRPTPVLFRHDELPILNGKSPHIPNVFVALRLIVPSAPPATP